MTCKSCEERRKLILEQVAALNAAFQARAQEFRAAIENRKPWKQPNETQDKQQ